MAARITATRIALQWILSVAPASRPREIDPGSIVAHQATGAARGGEGAACHAVRPRTTVAQLRPLAPQMPAPGNVAAPVRNSPGTAVS